MELLVVAFGALVIGVVIGGIVARVFSPRAALGVSVVLFVLAGVLWLIGANMNGWDGLAYLLPGLLGAAPAGLGAGVVGLIAFYGQRRGSGR